MVGGTFWDTVRPLLVPVWVVVVVVCLSLRRGAKEMSPIARRSAIMTKDLPERQEVEKLVGEFGQTS